MPVFSTSVSLDVQQNSPPPQRSKTLTSSLHTLTQQRQAAGVGFQPIGWHTDKKKKANVRGEVAMATDKHAMATCIFWAAHYHQRGSWAAYQCDDGGTGAGQRDDVEVVGQVELRMKEGEGELAEEGRGRWNRIKGQVGVLSPRWCRRFHPVWLRKLFPVWRSRE